jgi:HD-GYP domain-containing protein (c-di-GMP phosphodiesterase class II)
MKSNPDLLLNNRKITHFSDIFPILNEMLSNLCIQYNFNSSSLILIRNQKYLFDYYCPEAEETLKDKTLERTVMYQREADSYTNYVFLESIDLYKYHQRAKKGGSPFKLIEEGEYYQIYDDDNYINGLIEQNLFNPDHRSYKMADYNLYKSQPVFARNYKNFLDFYKKLVLPLRLEKGNRLQLFGYVVIDQFRLKQYPQLPLEEEFIKSLINFFDAFTLSWSAVISRFNENYLPVFNRIIDLEKQLSLFEHPPYTMSHLDNISVLYLYFLKWANATHDLALIQLDLFSAYMGARFHDVGKVQIPIEILNKKGPLNSEERSIIQNHPQWGIDLLTGSDLPQVALDIVLYHHILLDGSGYPSISKELPMLVKLFTPVDIFEALVSIRPYKRRFTLQEAFSVLREMVQNNKLSKTAVEWFIEYTTDLHKNGREFMEKNHLVVMDDQKILFDFIESIINKRTHEDCCI